MEIKFNNTLKEVQSNCSLQLFVNQIVLPNGQKGIAIAINDLVVPKNEWASYILQPLDDVLIISATQGG